MTLDEYIQNTGAKVADLAADMGCDPSFLSHVRSKEKPRKLPVGLAIKLYRKRGVKVVPIAHVSERDIGVLERFLNGGAA